MYFLILFFLKKKSVVLNKFRTAIKNSKKYFENCTECLESARLCFTELQWNNEIQIHTDRFVAHVSPVFRCFFFCLFCYRFTGTVRKVPRENSIEKKNILRLRVDDWYGISCRKVVPTRVFWNEHGREGDEKYKKEIHGSSSQKKNPVVSRRRWPDVGE